MSGSEDHVCLHSVIGCVLSRAPLFVTSQTAARQTSVHGVFVGKNTRVGCHFLLQGIFLIQGWNLCLLHLQVNFLLLSHWGSSFNHHSSSNVGSLKKASISF